MIYAIGSDNELIKVGTSYDPVARLKALQTANGSKLHLLLTLPGDHETESKIHSILASKREQGEWFRCSAEEIVAAWLTAQNVVIPARTNESVPSSYRYVTPHGAYTTTLDGAIYLYGIDGILKDTFYTEVLTNAEFIRYVQNRI